MKNLKTVFAFILLGFFCDHKANAETGSDSLSRKIEKIFESLCHDKSIQKQKKYCTFEYKKGNEPHVDAAAVKDCDNQLILAKVDDRFVSKLIAQFDEFCKDCKFDSSQYVAFKKENSFLVKGNYSIELNCASKKGKTTNLLCLIYGNNRYFLFALGH